MRELTRFEQEQQDEARTLADALFVQGIASRVDEGRDGGFVVWVHDETQLPEARELLAHFQANPDDPRFAEARRQAKAQREQERKKEKQTRHKTVRMRDRWQATRGIGRLTMGLIVVSVGISIVTKLGANHDIIKWLAIQSYNPDTGMFMPGFGDIFSGQIWRLVTPIFVHYGFLHILFNMLWLKDLGTMVEHKQSTVFLGAMVLVIAVISNVAQYIVGGQPTFGGMSGVVYGLLGYIWIRGKVDPGSGYGLPRFIIIWMMAWLLFGFTGIMNIANTAHVGGLLVGGGWGLLLGLSRRS